MNRFATAALATLLVTGSMTGAASAQSFGRDQDRGRGQQSQDERGRNDDRGRRDDDRGRRDDDRRDNRGWDSRRDNGFYANGRWHYGEPTAQQRRHRDYRSGYQNWRRGDRLPASYRAHYRQVDYRRERLRAPPRGYQYVRTDRGETLLVGIATGVILGIILSQ